MSASRQLHTAADPTFTRFPHPEIPLQMDAGNALQTAYILAAIGPHFGPLISIFFKRYDAAIPRGVEPWHISNF